MIDFLPFNPCHLAALELQPEQRRFTEVLRDPDYGKGLVAPNLAWSGVIDGKLVGCAGILPRWPGRAECWALMSPIPPRAWIKITREVQKTMERAHMDGHRRIEAVVLASFTAARRWVDLLGFELEGKMTAYGPDGSDHLLYSRVRYYDRD